MLFSIGVAIGLVLGLTGAGGSVFAVPLLVLLADLPVSQATGLSLGAVAASTLYASLHNWRRARILWAPGLVLALSGATFAPAGQWLATQISADILLTGFSLLAAIIAVLMWINARQNPQAAKIIRAGDFSSAATPALLCNLSQAGQFELKPRCLIGMVAGGIIVGLVSGLFGVGGGFLIIPLLMAVSSISMNQAVSTSLFIIAIISSSGFASHIYFGGSNDGRLMLLIASGGTLGMVAGQLIAKKLANALLQQLFAVALMLASVTLFAKRFLF